MNKDAWQNVTPPNLPLSGEEIINNKNIVDYNNFAKTFSSSRKKLKWEEINYFLSFLENNNDIKILDIWSWNWRFLSHIKDRELDYLDYLWVDLSEWLLEEASLLHPEARFLHLNMIELDKIKDRFNSIFFIASFHHLNDIESRESVLRKAYDILEDWWYMYMTNWSLESELNKQKYKYSYIKWTKNKFWSKDFDIKIWEFSRYYHCFDLKELEYLFNRTWFDIIENKEFENKKNFISILQKKG